MAWKNWNAIIYLGKCGVVLQDARVMGQVRARTHDEAETKACKIARQRGLSGLIGAQELKATCGAVI